MIGDNIIYHSSYQKITEKVIGLLQEDLIKNRICIAVAGESGSGKTSLAHALRLDIEKKLNRKGFVFHIDDYFFLPPKDNHNNRLKDLKNVGAHEVNLNLLDQQIKAFLTSQTSSLEKPLVIYEENRIIEEMVNPKAYDFCIVEGTYTMLLEEPAFKIFINKTYKETRANRLERARDVMDDFNEKVLQIEHDIISKQSKFADMII